MKHPLLTGALVGASAMAWYVWYRVEQAQPEGHIEGVVEGCMGHLFTVAIKEREGAWTPAKGQAVCVYPTGKATTIVDLEDDVVETNGTHLSRGGGGNS